MERIAAPTDFRGLQRCPLSVFQSPLRVLYVRDGADNYLLDAPYQRASVWDPARRVALVRSLLEHVPIGVIVIAEQHRESDAQYRVVDGKQRIETIRLFRAGEFTVPAEWFNSSELATVQRADDGSLVVDYGDLNELGRRRFDGMSIGFAEFKPDVAMQRRPDGSWDHDSAPATADALLAAEADLYLRINTGGVAHTDDELATAESILADRD